MPSPITVRTGKVISPTFAKGFASPKTSAPREYGKFRNHRPCRVSTILQYSLPRARGPVTRKVRTTMATATEPPVQDAATKDPPRLRFADVGINLSDPVFRGQYHGKQAHEDDLDDVVKRATDVGCIKMMVTGSNLKESEHAIDVAKRFPGICYATVGVHPCSAKSFDSYPGGPDAMLGEVRKLAIESRDSGFAVAFGEIGLDYDRLFLSEKEQQLKYFERQLELAVELGLPLFLHSRAAAQDFERLLRPFLPKLPKRGLVHSFTGTIEEMQQLLELGFDIGVNGCSLKTKENLEVVKQIPLDRMQIETDGPWCEMRPSHASANHTAKASPLPKNMKKEKFQNGLMVKGRNEPVAITHVAHAIASIKGLSVEEVSEAAWANSTKMFGLGVVVD